jgi:ABC-type bacteriocin/lantibiotic exporter with double-glycine peptidase domain
VGSEGHLSHPVVCRTQLSIQFDAAPWGSSAHWSADGRTPLIHLVDSNLLGRGFELLDGHFGLFQMRLSEWVQQRLFVRSASYFLAAMPKEVAEGERRYWYERVHRFFDTITIQKELPKILVTASAALLQLVFGFLLLLLYDFSFVAVSFIILAVAAVMLRVGFTRGLGHSIDESSEKYQVVRELEEFAQRRAKEGAYAEPPYRQVTHQLTEYLKNRRDHFKILYRMNGIMVGLRLALTALLLIAGGWLVVD